MLRLWRHLWVLFLAIGIATSCAAEPMPWQPAHPGHVNHSGCNAPMPAPKPVDTTCCAAGHDAIVLPIVISNVDFSGSQHHVVQRDLPRSFDVSSFCCSVMRSGDPPGLTPLRI